MTEEEKIKIEAEPTIVKQEPTGPTGRIPGELSEEQKAIQKVLDEERNTIDRLMELKDFWKFLEQKHGAGSRFKRKQFRRRFISEDNYAQELMESTTEYFRSILKKHEEIASKIN